MVRLGLCCTFAAADIKFRTTTATAQRRRRPRERRSRLRALAAANADALAAAIEYCSAHGIGSFRVTSRILPLRTHPELGYDARSLGEKVVGRFRTCRALAAARKVRITFHPDQFIVLSTPHRPVLRSSLAEIEHLAEVAGWIGGDVITIHGGGGYGDPAAALDRLHRALDRLSPRARALITLENDERVYSPSALLPLCRAAGVPLVYDVHHHRLNPDRLTIEEATAEAISTWPREPVFHVSSPRHGWSGPHPERHHDFIALRDFPPLWQTLDVTVEIEAKAKELAIARLRRALHARSRRLRAADRSRAGTAGLRSAR